MPSEMNIGEMIAAFLVPGLAVWLRGPSLWGRAALAASAALILIFIIWLGYPAANLGFGLLVSLHATGFIYYCNPLMAAKPFRVRLEFACLVLLAIGQLLYMPARNLIQDHWLMPLNMNGRVIVVQRIFQTQGINRGDRVAYLLHPGKSNETYNREGAIQIRRGLGLGQVLAVAGDRINFFKDSFSVNGISHPCLPHMPGSGEFIVPEKHWFIWPDIDISGHGFSAAVISNTLLTMASVNETQLYGKAFPRWFWRKQILP